MPSAMTTPVAAMPRTVAAFVIVLGRVWLCGLRRRSPRRTAGRVVRTSFDDLVKFATVQPDATALGAIVDLDTLPFTHDQIDLANRTSQPMTLVRRCGVCAFNHFSLPRVKG